MGRPKRRRVRIRIRQKALVQKKDKTRVSLPDTTSYPRMAAQMPRDNGVVFRVKLKRKND